MNSKNLAKVIAAFGAGAVVALGTALIWVQAHGASPKESATRSPAIQESAPAVASPKEVPDRLPDAGQRPAAPVPETPAKAAGKVNRVARSRAAVRPAAPVEVAQNRPPQLVEKPAAPPVVPPTPAAPVQIQPVPPPAQPAPVQAPPAPIPAPVAPRRQPRTITLEQGTPLVVRMGETVSTDHNYSGDTFRATLDQPLIIDSAIIADRGSKVLGRVVTVQKAGRIQGVSDLSLAVVEINTTDGQRVSVQSSSVDQRGQTSRTSDSEKVGGGAALGAIIGAVSGGGRGAGIGAGVGGAAGVGDVLLTRGKPAVVQSEARLTFRLAAPVTITEKLNY